MANPNWNDGTIPYGTRTEVVNRGGSPQGTYVFEQLQITRPTNVIRRKDQTGQPNGSVGQPDFVTGTATVQIPTSASNGILPGDTFTDTFDSSLSAETFILSEIGQPEEQTAYKKFTVQFIKRYN
jgi:hypothetical protein